MRFLSFNNTDFACLNIQIFMLQKGNNKSAGFIKMKSLKHLEILQQHNDEESSGDFSSFEYQKELHGDSS